MLISLYLRFQIKREKTEYVTLMSINNSKEDIIRTKQKFEQMKSQKFEAAMRQKENESNSDEVNAADETDDENNINRSKEPNQDEIDNKEDDTDE